MDLKQLVYDFKIYRKEDRPVFYMKVSTGSTDNLNQELVYASFYEYLRLEFDPLSIQIHRIDVYGRIDEKLVSLGQMGEIIE